MKPKKNLTRQKVKQMLTPRLVLSKIKWSDAYPYVEETYEFCKETIVVHKFVSSESPDYEKFIFSVVRSDAIPTFVKKNLKKIRQLIEAEFQHRDKLEDKLSKEQRIAFTSFFNDRDFFDRTSKSDYFEHEIEKVYADYLRAYCTTALYESQVRNENVKRIEILNKMGIK